MLSAALQGVAAQAEIDKKIRGALATAGIVRLGGDTGQQKGYGKCLCVQASADSGLDKIRSSLGNALAEQSAGRGLRAMGLIAYREVRL